MVHFVIYIHIVYSLDIVRMSLVIYMYILYSLDIVRRLVAGPKISHSHTSSTCHRAVPIEDNTITTLQKFHSWGCSVLQCVAVCCSLVPDRFVADHNLAAP